MRFLSANLPGYMIPAYVVELDTLPLTSSGKVDRKALPAPDDTNVPSGTQYAAPRNPIEQTLADIWEQVLGRNEIGIHDNFFHLGGHSLRAIQLAAKVQATFALEWPLQVVFQHPTLLEQATQLQAMLTFNTQYVHPAGLCFNAGAPRTIFAFPAILGLAVGYQGLSVMLPDVSMYSFDFLIAEDRFDQYYQQIKAEQPTGPYLLFGYSAGGNLAYEMAAWMEARGEKISAVILADSVVRLVAQSLDWERYSQSVAEELQKNGDELGQMLFKDTTIRKKAKQRVLSYDAFLNSIRMDTQIQADIYLMQAEKAEDSDALDTMHQDWGQYTRGEFYGYQSSGDHANLLTPPHLESNAALLHRIIAQIAEGSSESEDTTVFSDVADMQHLWEQHRSLYVELLQLQQEAAALVPRPAIKV
jgi:thioesterase domain-containing protein